MALCRRDKTTFAEEEALSLFSVTLCLFTFLLLTFLFVCYSSSGETVSLVDVDISQRGANTPHPPTPPPPPRRSLSLLGTAPLLCRSLFLSLLQNQTFPSISGSDETHLLVYFSDVYLWSPATQTRFCNLP